MPNHLKCPGVRGGAKSPHHRRHRLSSPQAVLHLHSNNLPVSEPGDGSAAAHSCAINLAWESHLHSWASSSSPLNGKVDTQCWSAFLSEGGLRGHTITDLFETQRNLYTQEKCPFCMQYHWGEIS